MIQLSLCKEGNFTANEQKNDVSSPLAIARIAGGLGKLICHLKDANAAMPKIGFVRVHVCLSLAAKLIEASPQPGQTQARSPQQTEHQLN